MLRQQCRRTGAAASRAWRVYPDIENRDL